MGYHNYNYNIYPYLLFLNFELFTSKNYKLSFTKFTTVFN